ncbi:hypothetical protein F4802DRAFT_52336 [Xylaria palmicola]|nr:hypothetical protein F4802DRAFT_52336 [Xylaria palmicola]
MDHLTHTLPSSSSRNTSPAVSNFSESSANMTKSTTDKVKAGKRKGTRSVSTLTPSQLARKRANDREAQRAIRARTKEHIENLEREIDELRSQQNRDQTVRDLLGRNRALEEEVRRLRESLGIRAAAPGLQYPNSYNGPNPQPSPYGQSTPEYPMVSDLPPYSNVHDTTNVWPGSVPCSLPSTVSSPSSPAAPEDYPTNYFQNNPSTAMLERSSMPPTLNSPAASCITSGGDIGFDNVKSATSRVWMPPTDRHRAHLSDLPATAMERVPRVLLSASGNDPSRHTGPSYWENPVLTSENCCQDDALITGYVSDCRRLTDLAGGQPHLEVILGPHRPDMRPLLRAHTHLLSSLGLPAQQATPSYPLVDIVASIFDANNLELPLERVGGFLLFRALIAWLVQPTRETYIGLGEILPPQSIQRTIPHPQWMDFILWPHLRSAIIERQGIYNTPEFRHIYCTNLRLKNWPVAITEALSVDFAAGSIYATDEFSEHVWDLRNWGMHENFTRRYPELEACLGEGWSV